MKIVSEVKSQQELDEMKSVMEIFVVSFRIKQLAGMAQSTFLPVIFYFLIINNFLKYIILLNENINNVDIDYKKTTPGVDYGRETQN